MPPHFNGDDLHHLNVSHTVGMLLFFIHCMCSVFCSEVFHPNKMTLHQINLKVEGKAFLCCDKYALRGSVSEVPKTT